MAGILAEPAILAAAKDALYPGIDTSTDHYTITKAQFTTPAWGDWTILDGVRRRLAPFNTIRLAGGEPDLLGVGMPALKMLNDDAAMSPVTVIEAKEHNSDPSAADVRRGIN